MKTVLLIGRSDHDNFGDSLIFAFYVKHYSSKGFKVNIYKATDIFIKRIAELGYDCSSVNSVVGSNLALFIGGGYFGEPDRKKAAWNKRFVERNFFGIIADDLVKHNVPYIIHGAEVGPLSSDTSRRIVSRVLASAKHVVVRNEASQSFISKQFKLNASLKRDIIFGETSRFSKQDSNAQASETHLVIHATGKILRNNPFSRAFRRRIKHFIARELFSGATILFDQSTFPDLIPLAHRFSEEISQKGVRCSVLEYHGITQVLECLSSCTHIITTKLHVGVVGLSYRKNVMCVSSMAKNTRFYNEVCGGKGIIGLVGFWAFRFRISSKHFASHTDIDDLHYRSSLSYIDDLDIDSAF